MTRRNPFIARLARLLGDRSSMIFRKETYATGSGVIAISGIESQPTNYYTVTFKSAGYAPTLLEWFHSRENKIYIYNPTSKSVIERTNIVAIPMKPLRQTASIQ
jgi:hypothetical protein